MSPIRRRDTQLRARPGRTPAPRRGQPQAAGAGGHPIRIRADHRLPESLTAQERGVHDGEQRHRQVVERRLVRRVEGLGYRVSREPRVA